MGIETPPKPDQPRQLEKPSGESRTVALKERNSSLEERRAAAKQALPGRFHTLIDRSDVVAVMSAEQYNYAFRSERPMEQLPARTTREVVGQDGRVKERSLNVVELKLGDDLEAGQVHGMDASDPTRAWHGRWFLEHDPRHCTPAQAKEAAVIRRTDFEGGVEEYLGKTHASFGRIERGSTVTISEVGPRTFKAQEAADNCASAQDVERRSRPLDALYPPLDAEGPRVFTRPERPDDLPATYQFELVGNEPSRAFEATSTVPLPRDQIH